MNAPTTTLGGQLAPVDGTGRFRVVRPGSTVLRWLGDLLGLPPAGDDVVVTLRVRAGDDEDRWDRTFDGRHVVSRVRCEGPVLVERMGGIEVRFRIERPGPATIALVPLSASLACGAARLPLPRWCTPAVRCRISSETDAHHVTVSIATPGGTTVCSYDGTLVDAREAMA